MESGSNNKKEIRTRVTPSISNQCQNGLEELLKYI